MSRASKRASALRTLIKRRGAFVAPFGASAAALEATTIHRYPGYTISVVEEGSYINAILLLEAVPWRPNMNNLYALSGAELRPLVGRLLEGSMLRGTLRQPKGGD